MWGRNCRCNPLVGPPATQQAGGIRSSSLWQRNKRAQSVRRPYTLLVGRANERVHPKAGTAQHNKRAQSVRRPYPLLLGPCPPLEGGPTNGFSLERRARPNATSRRNPLVGPIHYFWGRARLWREGQRTGPSILYLQESGEIYSCSVPEQFQEAICQRLHGARASAKPQFWLDRLQF
jgi:hypothetical protein